MEKIQDALTRIVGAENVCGDPKVLSEYSQDKSFAPGLPPRCAVRVHNAGEVGAVVKWANETRTPLVSVSSQAPHYKGDTAPGVPEAVIVDLSGMKKILSINRKYRMAVIEPGVTYGELLKALAGEGLTLSVPLATRAGKSVVASVLETEPRLNALHQWCDLDPLRCVEVTWGDGNRMFTGEAGGSVMDLEQQWKEDKWQWEPAGPMMLDFYRLLTGAQGTMGIVTWASVRCEIMPQAHKAYIVPARKLEDLVDFAYNVLRLRFSDEFFIMNNTQMAYLMADKAGEVDGLKEQLPPWMAVVGIAGREILPEERVAAQEADISEIAQNCGLKMPEAVGGISAEAVLRKAARPGGDASWKEIYKGAFQDIFFSTTLDQTPKFIQAMGSLSSQEGYPVCDVGVYLQPENMGASYHCSFTLPYRADCASETGKTRELFVKASMMFSRMGAYYFRPYGIWSRLQLNKDAQGYQVLQRLKGIFDPNGIMNPGKLCNY
jgi:FAD/FMN-containing dehydrogenase